MICDSTTLRRNQRGWNAIVWQPKALRDASWASGGSVEVAYSEITLDNAIQALNGQTLLDRCANTGDALSCATITRTASGAVSAITNPLINIGGIKTRAVDLNINWSSPEWGFGRFSLNSYTTFLLEFTEFQPTSGGLAPLSREGTERGSPDQAYPKTKSPTSTGRTAAGRHRHPCATSPRSETGAVNNRRPHHVDAQLRWTPGYRPGR